MRRCAEKGLSNGNGQIPKIFLSLGREVPLPRRNQSDNIVTLNQSNTNIQNLVFATRRPLKENYQFHKQGISARSSEKIYSHS